MLSGSQIVLLLMHDPIGCADGPFGVGPIDQTQGRIRFDEPFLQDAKIPSRESGLLDLHRQILDLPAPGQFPAGLAGLRDLHDGRPH